MRIFITLFTLFVFSIANADTKSLAFNAGKVISYDVPTGWEQSRKPAPENAEVQLIRLKKNVDSEIQIMFISIRPESPLAKESTSDKLIADMHKEVCQQYLDSIEGDHPATKVASKNYSGYVSSFTDKSYPTGPVPSGEFRIVSRFTFVVGPTKSGVIALITVFSQDLLGADYQAMKAIVESLRLNSQG